MKWYLSNDDLCAYKVRVIRAVEHKYHGQKWTQYKCRVEWSGTFIYLQDCQLYNTKSRCVMAAISRLAAQC